MPNGPWSWPWNEGQVGNLVRKNYRFLDALWNAQRQPLLRQELLGKDEDELRNELEFWGLTVPQNVRIVLVDIESATIHNFGVNPQDEEFYTLVLPPMPRRLTLDENGAAAVDENGDPYSDQSKDVYAEMQAWAGAWYHATSDGYGM